MIIIIIVKNGLPGRAASRRPAIILRNEAFRKYSGFQTLSFCLSSPSEKTSFDFSTSRWARDKTNGNLRLEICNSNAYVSVMCIPKCGRCLLLARARAAPRWPAGSLPTLCCAKGAACPPRTQPATSASSSSPPRLQPVCCRQSESPVLQVVPQPGGARVGRPRAPASGAAHAGPRPSSARAGRDEIQIHPKRQSTE